MNLSIDRHGAHRGRGGSPSSPRGAQLRPQHWHTSFRAANLRPSFLVQQPVQQPDAGQNRPLENPPLPFVSLAPPQAELHLNSPHNKTSLPRRLQPLLAIPPTANLTTAHFERLFHAFAQRWDIAARLTTTTWTPAGLRIGIDTCENLNRLWNYRQEWEATTGWELLPRPPPQPWLQLNNIPVNLKRDPLLRELFDPCNQAFHQLRDLRWEISNVVVQGRTAYIKGPPELREAARTEIEAIIGIRLVTFQDYVHLKMCRQCSSLDHLTTQCDSEEYCCGYCAQADHPTGKCPLWHQPHRHQCCNCMLASRPQHLLRHAALDQWHCPITQDFFERRRAEIEYRPLVYRELRKLWLLHQRAQNSKGEPLAPRPSHGESS